MARWDPFGWVGATLDRKVVVESVVGEGGFGVVYRGHHLGFDLPVAVKCLRLPQTSDEAHLQALLDAFRAEARLLHRLSQRTAHIVQALDAGAAHSPNGQFTPYIVMEWLDGETLADHLSRRAEQRASPYGLREAVRRLTPAARALSVAHAEHVFHRDIKPGNLFIVRAGAKTAAWPSVPNADDHTLKVVDFGIAKVLSDVPQSSVTTPTWARIFTPYYAAPEQMSLDLGRSGPWTDVFALALVLAEVATGARLLQGTGPADLLVSAMSAHDRVAALPLAIDGCLALEPVLRKALSPRPHDRYSDADAMWRAVEAALDSRPPRSSDRPLGGSEELRPSGENRVCTVLAVDLNGLVETAPHPDEAHEMIARAADVAADIVAAHGGRADRSVEAERVIGVFGVPEADESDAERAVQAALLVRNALGRACPGGWCRIGVATGRTFVDRAGRAIGVAGGAARSAIRAMQQAPLNAVVLTSETRRLVRSRFNFERIARDDGAAPLWAAVSRLAVPHGPTPTDFCGLDTDIFGRSEEKRAIDDAISVVAAGGGARALLFVGAPGLGRTRLLEHALSEVLSRSTRFVVLSAQASSLATSTSYGFAAALCRHRFGIADEDAPPRALRKLRRGLRWFRAKVRGHAPQDALELDDALLRLAAVLGAAASPTIIAERSAADDIEGSLRHRTAAAAERFLRFVTPYCPVVVLCDDIHLADRASLELLADLMIRTEDVPWLVVATARPSAPDGPSPSNDLSEIFPGIERITLLPLPDPDMRSVLRDHLRRVPDLSEMVLDLLTSRACGVPHRLVETLHWLIDGGVLEADADGPWRLHAEGLDRLEWPASVQGVVLARLDRLGPEIRRVAAQAAVMGRCFWKSALQRLAASDPEWAGIDVERAIDVLLDRKWIRGVLPPSSSGDRELLFVDALTCDVAYDLLSGRAKRGLHRAAADWLDSHSHLAGGLSVLALHRERAGQPGLAALAHADAAEQAASIGALAEAIHHWERAIALHAQAVSQQAPSETWSAPLFAVARWSTRLGDALRRTGQLDAARSAYRAALDAIDARANDDGVAQVLAARVRYGLATIAKVRGEGASALAEVHRAIALAEQAGAEDETPPMFALVAFLHRRAKNAEASWSAARRGLAVCRAVAGRDARAREHVAQILLGLAAAQYARGRGVRVERAYRQAIRVLSEIDNPHLAGLAYNGLGVVRYEQGDLAGAKAMLERALRLKVRAGDLHQIAVAQNNLAELLLRSGDAAGAIDHARKAVQLASKVNATSDQAEMHRLVAEASRSLGDIEGAMSAALQALTIAETHGLVYLGLAGRTLAATCQSARQHPSAAMRMWAIEAERRLRASLDARFLGPELAVFRLECEQILSGSGVAA